MHVYKRCVWIEVRLSKGKGGLIGRGTGGKGDVAGMRRIYFKYNIDFYDNILI